MGVAPAPAGGAVGRRQRCRSVWPARVAPGRSARVQRDPRAARRPAALCRLRQRAAAGRDRPVLLRRRPADSRGLRPDGDVAGALRDAARARAARHRRPAAAERRSAHRRRRRDSGARAEHHARATTAGPRTRPRRFGTAGSTRATSARSTRDGYLRDHRPQEGAARHVRRQENRAAADRGGAARAIRSSPRPCSSATGRQFPSVLIVPDVAALCAPALGREAARRWPRRARCSTSRA